MIDGRWPERFAVLLSTIESIQRRRHTVSQRELEAHIGVSRQTINNWLGTAEEMGYIDMHGGQPRAMELLPAGRKLAKAFEDRAAEARDDLRRRDEKVSRVPGAR